MGDVQRCGLAPGFPAGTWGPPGKRLSAIKWVERPIAAQGRPALALLVALDLACFDWQEHRILTSSRDYNCKEREKAVMAEGRFVAYYRVSTEKQGRSGLGLEAQRQDVEAYLNGGSWKLVAEFTEIESGKRSERPKLAEAIKTAKKHKATLVIAKLDRLSRNVAFIANLIEAGADFVAVDMPHANKLTIHILSAVAEHEREMISQRTRAALAAAKSRGVKLGNRSNIGVAQANSRTIRTAEADQFASNIQPVVLQIKAAGIRTLSGIAEALNARGLRTPRGGDWQAVQVKRVLGRHRPARPLTNATK